MRILFISCSPWRDDNNIGNTYTNIFKGIDDLEIAHICCGGGSPSSDFVKKHFHISEKALLLNLIDRKISTGTLAKEDAKYLDNLGGKRFFNFMRKTRFQIFFWIRELIWLIGRWKSKELDQFIEEFNPDLLFVTFLDNIYLNRLILYVKEKCKKPLAVYAWDDVASLKRFSFSPLYWLNVMIQRPKLKKVAQKADLFYVISPMQQRYYAEYFKKPCKIITKGRVFYTEQEVSLNKPLQMVYAGNLGTGRVNSLIEIVKALKVIDKDEIIAQIQIYTLTPLSGRQKRQLCVNNISFLNKPLKGSEVDSVLNKADILIHVEPLNKVDASKVAMSFSTKLVDYFSKRKCILAVGPKDVSSIDLLKKENIAAVATGKKEIIDVMKEILYDTDKLKFYANNAWLYGQKNYDIKKIQKSLVVDFAKAMEKDNEEDIAN